MKSQFIIYFLLSIFLSACNKQKTTTVVENNQNMKKEEVKEEDCDKDKAKKELEKIKKEEFSLSKGANDPGCTLEEKK